jgi:hypothetical protein
MRERFPNHTNPFGLSLSKPFDRLRSFDKLRMLGPFDELRANGTTRREMRHAQ